MHYLVNIFRKIEKRQENDRFLLLGRRRRAETGGADQETGNDRFLMWKTDTRGFVLLLSCVIFIYVLEIIKELISWELKDVQIKATLNIQ